MTTTITLIQFEGVRRALAEARSIDEIKNVRDKAEALRLYVKQQGDSLEMQNDIAEIKIRAERRAGELLAEMEKAKGSDYGGKPTLDGSRALPSNPPPTLSDMGISKPQSSRWQRTARIPEETFEQHIAETKADGEKELTSAGVQRLARNLSTMRVMGSSESPEWYTPQKIVDAVLGLFGQIDLDPCSNSHDAPNVPATKHYTKEDDGLNQQWVGKVYMNPPYGREIISWIDKLVGAYEAGEIDEAIALLPARIDTAWFQPLYKHLICHVRGRLQFVGSNNSAPFPSVIVYLGHRRDSFIETFKRFGPIMERVG